MGAASAEDAAAAPPASEALAAASSASCPAASAPGAAAPAAAAEALSSPSAAEASSARARFAPRCRRLAREPFGPARRADRPVWPSTARPCSSARERTTARAKARPLLTSIPGPSQERATAKAAVAGTTALPLAPLGCSGSSSDSGSGTLEAALPCAAETWLPVPAAGDSSPRRDVTMRALSRRAAGKASAASSATRGTDACTPGMNRTGSGGGRCEDPGPDAAVDEGAEAEPPPRVMAACSHAGSIASDTSAAAAVAAEGRQSERELSPSPSLSSARRRERPRRPDASAASSLSSPSPLPSCPADPSWAIEAAAAAPANGSASAEAAADSAPPAAAPALPLAAAAASTASSCAAMLNDPLPTPAYGPPSPGSSCSSLPPSASAVQRAEDAASACAARSARHAAASGGA